MKPSIPAVIDDCEIQISWDGIDGVISNRGLEAVYRFRDCLQLVRSSEKLAVINDAINVLESAHHRRPTQQEAHDIFKQHAQIFHALDSRYFACSEDLEQLTQAYLVEHPEHLDQVKLDRASSEMADRLFVRVAGDAHALPQLSGEPLTIEIDLTQRLSCRDSSAVIKSLEPQLGRLTPGSGNLTDRETILAIIKQQWGRPICIVFVGCDALAKRDTGGSKIVYELRTFFPTLFTGIRSKDLSISFLP